MQKISTNAAAQAIGPYSQAIKTGNFIFTSGQIALKPNGDFLDSDIRTQTAQVCENLGAILKEAGVDFDCVVKTSVFLSDMADFGAMNEVYEKYFISKPARSTIAVKELPKGAKVEIECVAILNH